MRHQTLHFLAVRQSTLHRGFFGAGSLRGRLISIHGAHAVIRAESQDQGKRRLSVFRIHFQCLYALLGTGDVEVRNFQIDVKLLAFLHPEADGLRNLRIALHLTPGHVAVLRNAENVQEQSGGPISDVFPPRVFIN